MADMANGDIFVLLIGFVFMSVFLLLVVSVSVKEMQR